MRHLADVSPAQQEAIDQHNADIDRQVGELNRQLTETRQLVRHVLLKTRLAGLSETIRGDALGAAETPADKRNEVQKYLADKFWALLTVKPEEIAAALDEPTRQKLAGAEQQIAALQSTRQSYGIIQATWDVAQPPAAYLYRRGGYETPGAVIEPGFPAVLTASSEPLPTPAGQQATSGYRSVLARWLTGPNHPLTSRVIVNRIWQQYFGRGIVSTPDNFGRSGRCRLILNLLDWLASEFMHSGWRFKAFHRLILTSTAYRQASSPMRAPCATGGQSIRHRH